MRVTVKKSAKASILLSAGIILTLSSCLKEKEASTPIAKEVTYENTIKGILNTRGCEGCHSGQIPVLTSYAAVKTSFTKVKASINHDAGASNMPKGGSKMPNAEIKAFQEWEAGQFKEK